MDEPGYTLLHRAARSGSADEIRALLLRPDVKIDAQDHWGRTPLHLASTEGREDTVRLLMVAGASTDVLDKDKVSPLDCAAGSGSLATVRLFFSPTPPCNKECWSAAAWAARRGHLEVFSILLDELHGRGGLRDHLLNCCQQKGREAILWVAKLGRVDMATELLRRWPAAVSFELNAMGSTMIIIAARSRRVRMVRFLLDHAADPLQENRRFANALNAAAWKGSRRVIEVLWEHTTQTFASREKLLQLWNARGSEHPPLCKAAQEGRLENVQRLVELGLDVNTSDAFGHTPLCLAARGGERCRAVVSWLLSKGTNWQEDLFCAARRGDEVAFSALTNELDERAVDWRDVRLVSTVGGSATFASVLLSRWPETIALSLDEKGTTMLHMAAGRGHADLVRTLLQLGADPLQRDKESWAALQYAAWGGAVGVIDALWEHTERSSGTRAGLLGLLCKRLGRHSDAAPLALQRPAQLLRLWRGLGEKDPPLCVAAEEGHVEFVKRLVELVEPKADGGRAKLRIELLDTRDHRKATCRPRPIPQRERGSFLPHRPNTRDRRSFQGQTPLYLAVQGGQRCSAVVSWLLGEGADWWEAVSCAVRREDASAFHTLIDELDRRNIEWREERTSVVVAEGGSAAVANAMLDRWPEAVQTESSPSMLLVAARCSHANLVRTLLDRGADLLQRDRRGRTALHFAAVSGSEEVIRALWEHTELCAESRESLKRLIEGRGEEEPPLCWAAAGGHLAAVKLLLACGADMLQRDCEGRTALHHAAERGSVAMISALCGHAGHSTESRARLGWVLRGRGERYPPLCLAAAKGHLAAVRLLLARGANQLQRDCEGWIALYHAASRGSLEVIRALWEHTEQSRWDRAELQRVVEGRLPLCWIPPGQLKLKDVCLPWSRSHPTLRHDVETRVLPTADSLLYSAAEGGHVEVVRWLLGAGAHLLPIEGEDSPLHVSARRGHLAVVQLLLPDPAQLGEQERRDRLALLQHGDEGGATALHQAVMNARKEVVQLLLKREVQLLEEHYTSRVRAGQSPQWEGFTVYRRDAQGRTPLQCSTDRGSHVQPGVLRVLLRHMEDERVMDLGGQGVRRADGVSHGAAGRVGIEFNLI